MTIHVTSQYFINTFYTSFHSIRIYNPVCVAYIKV